MQELLSQIIKDPLSAVLVIGNLVLIESLLSVDNAAVLATMVLELPKNQRKKALSYGIIGAYVFRGLCLLFAAYIIKIWWLKPIGGVYLLYLLINYIIKKRSVSPKEGSINKDKNPLYRKIVGKAGVFWSTIVLVELMDLAFSIDNVFAAVAFSKNILIILLGVFIGILAMRFVTGGFVKLMEKFPFLEDCAFVVIGILGIKLSMSVYIHFYPLSTISAFLESNRADWLTSAFTICIFFIPVITSLLFNYPKKNKLNSKV